MPLNLPISFYKALGINTIWVNLSEVWRYFYIIKPTLNDIYPNAPHIADMTPLIFLSWAVWDTILILSGTYLYWLYLNLKGPTVKSVLVISGAFTVTVFGLLWLGLINMGFVPIKLIYIALPLAFVEQYIAALITRFFVKKTKKEA